MSLHFEYKCTQLKNIFKIIFQFFFIQIFLIHGYFYFNILTFNKTIKKNIYIWANIFYKNFLFKIQFLLLILLQTLFHIEC